MILALRKRTAATVFCQSVKVCAKCSRCIAPGKSLAGRTICSLPLRAELHSVRRIATTVNLRRPATGLRSHAFRRIPSGTRMRRCYGSGRVDQDCAGAARPFRPCNDSQFVRSCNPRLAKTRRGAGRGTFVLKCSQVFSSWTSALKTGVSTD